MLAEVGSKDADFIMAPYVWVEQIERDLEAGAWKVIAEARESGTAGIYRADGEVRTGLIDEIAHAIDTERLIFERRARAAGVAAEALRHGVQPRQHRARRRALAGDAPAGPALGHGRALRAGRRGLTEAAAGGGRRAAPSGRARAGRRSAGAGRVRAAGLACFAAFFLITQRLKHTPDGRPGLQAGDRLLALSRRPVPARGDLVQARKRRRRDGHDHRLAGNTVATLVRDLPGAALQNALAALERAPRHRSPLRSRSDPRRTQRPRPATPRAAGPPGNTASACSCSHRDPQVLCRAASRWWAVSSALHPAVSLPSAPARSRRRRRRARRDRARSSC